MYTKKQPSAREQYREESAQRVNESPTLAAKFPGLKSLTAELQYSDSQKGSVTSRIKYTLNPEASKSVFRFRCPNSECIRGDFDLSDELAEAISERRSQLTGELNCPGWLSKTTIDTVHCRVVLRYKLTLAYGVGAKAKSTAA
jgi:hypothetical protein